MDIEQPTFRPSDVRDFRSDVIPFANAFGRVEHEIAAALYVECCRRRGDTWQPCVWSTVAHVYCSMIEEEQPPAWILCAKIGIAADFIGLAEAGAIRFEGVTDLTDGVSADIPMIPTPAFFEKVQKYLRG